jgi:hypothetical protein
VISAVNPRALEPRTRQKEFAGRLATAGLQLAVVLMTCARIIRRCTRVKFTPIRCTSAELLFSCCDSVAAPRQRSGRHDQVYAKNNERLCVCVSSLVTMVCIWCTRSLGRLNFLDLLLRHNALVGGHPGPRKRQMNILLLVDTTIEGASPSHARQE